MKVAGGKRVRERRPRFGRATTAPRRGARSARAAAFPIAPFLCISVALRFLSFLLLNS